MRIRILGASAGGGLPQWNCQCPNCAAVRAGSPDILPRTQSSVAVSGDGASWFLLNVSPDIRQQIIDFPELAAGTTGHRGTAIAGCILTDSGIDHTIGLLLLREGCSFQIYSTATVRRWLNRDLPLESILAKFADRPWTEMPIDGFCELRGPDQTSSSLRVRPFELDPHVPRFVNEDPAQATGSVIGLVIEDSATGGKLVYAPCVASITESLIEAVGHADAILMDGTFWAEDEMIRLAGGDRTASDMGHLPVSGPNGSLLWLASLQISHRIYVHINNTNPMLNQSSPEYQQVRRCGVRVGADADEIEL